MNCRPIIFLLTAFFVTPLYGGEDDVSYRDENILNNIVSYVVDYQGRRCSMKVFIEKQENSSVCNGMIVSVFKTGRVQYVFPIIQNGQPAAMAFSGGKDRQPTLNHYELEIDAFVYMGKETDKAIRKAAKGLCTMDGDPNEAAIFRCTATLSNHHPSTRYEFIFESVGATIYRSK